jgi:polyisoprenoid-binding protein YceI
MTSRHVLLAALAVAAAPSFAAGVRYAIDPAHTYPSIEMEHMGISIFRGKFDRTSGQVLLDRAARTGLVDIQVDTASIDFGHAQMNDKARTADYLDAARHPSAAYKGRLLFEGDVPVAVDGQLTLHGVTRPLKLAIHRFTCIEHPMRKREVCGADAEGELDRAEFGITRGAEGGKGRIHLRIQVEALRDS